LGKVHPGLLVQTCSAWLSATSPSPERRGLVEHALRSAVKRGEAGALSLLGFGKRPAISVEDVRFSPRRVTIGGRVALNFTLRSTGRSSQQLLVDLCVHFVKASGKRSPKVFKLERLSLPAGGKKRLSTSVSLAVHSTRKPHRGRHRVDVLANGVPLPLGDFHVTDALPLKARTRDPRRKCRARSPGSQPGSAAACLTHLESLASLSASPSRRSR
jgi:hypothetical protein